MEIPKELHAEKCEAEKRKLSSIYYRERQLERAIKKYCKRNQIINSARIAKIGESYGFRLGGTEKPYYGR